MKRTITSIILLYSIVSGAFAQVKNSGFSVKIYGGYGFLTPGSDRLAFQGDFFVIDNNTQATYTTAKQGLGAGLHYGGGIEKQLSGLFSVGVDADYLRGIKQTAMLSQSNFGGAELDEVSSSAAYSVLSIIPHVTFNVLPLPAYVVYTRLGVIGAIRTKYRFMHTETITGDGSSSVANDDYTYNYGTNLGVQAAGGIKFNIAGRVKVFAELAGNFLAVRATSAHDVSLSTVNNVTNEVDVNIIYRRLNTGDMTPVETYSNGHIIRTQTLPAFYQHINSVAFDVGISVDIK